jgi:hypothetical protein
MPVAAVMSVAVVAPVAVVAVVVSVVAVVSVAVVVSVDVVAVANHGAEARDVAVHTSAGGQSGGGVVRSAERVPSPIGVHGNGPEPLAAHRGLLSYHGLRRTTILRWCGDAWFSFRE